MKKLLTLGIAASMNVVMAAETFGGIGLAIYPSDMGAKVADVVAGAAADRAGIASGDYLLSADGIDLAGQTLDFDMETLRGAPGQRMDITVLRNADTLSVVVEREELVVKTEDDVPMFKKTASEEKLQFLDEVSLPGLSAKVYGKQAAPQPQIAPQNSLNMERIQHFNRSEMSFHLNQDGRATVALFGANGQLARTFEMDGFTGENQIAWDGKNLPSGNYFIRVSQSGKPLYFKGTLK